MLNVATRIVGRSLAGLLLAAPLLVGLPLSAGVDHCGGLSDCSVGVKIALAVGAVALAVLLWEFLVGEAGLELLTELLVDEEGAMTLGQVGRVIGWGEGQGAAAVAQTEALTQNLTTEAVEQMISKGMTEEFVTDMIAKYEAAVARGTAAKNAQLLPRLELMRKILELWPK